MSTNYTASTQALSKASKAQHNATKSKATKPSKRSKAVQKHNAKAPLPADFDFSVLAEGDSKGLRRALRGVLPGVNGRVRGITAEFLRGLTVPQPGRRNTHADALRHAGMQWGQFRSLLSAYPALRDVYGVAEAIQAVVLRHSREDALQKRAVDGWEEPVWYKGNQVGTVRRYSDKLLETALRASDPETYSDKTGASVNISGETVSLSFVTVGVDHTGPKAHQGDQEPATIDVQSEDEPKDEDD